MISKHFILWGVPAYLPIFAAIEMNVSIFQKACKNMKTMFFFEEHQGSLSLGARFL